MSLTSSPGITSRSHNPQPAGGPTPPAYTHHDMKIYTAEECPQGSAIWARRRAMNFTASRLGPFAIEPVKITLTVDEIKAELDERGIIRTGLTKRETLLARLPSKESYAKLSAGARTAIISQIKQERMQSIRDRVETAVASRKPILMSQEEDILITRDEELALKEEKQFEYNIPVRYGKLLEPFARAYYEKLTGFHVSEVGFVEHGDGASGFGCSPDGFAWTPGDGKSPTLSHGCEIKCPIPETHIAWLLDGGLPDEHRFQVEACMAVTGLDRWDFLSYCPGESPLLVTTYRSEFTEQLLSGLQTLVAEKAKIKRILAAKWEAAYQPSQIEA